MTPLISVVISTYNRPYELCESLELLTRQTFHDFEVVIVNDAGPSIDFVTSLYPDLQIRIVNHTTNRQLVHAKNTGVEHARGKYIMLCDDDDLLLPIHMEKMLEHIDDCELVYSDTEIFDFHWSNHMRVPTTWLLFAYDNSYEEMRKFSTFFSSGALYRKRLHDKIGIFDPYLQPYWDWDFYLRVAKAYAVHKVPIASTLYAFAEDGDNMSKQSTVARMYLDRLSAKHNLGSLPTSNFKQLLEEPEVQARKTPSLRFWDGTPVRSRIRENPSFVL